MNTELEFEPEGLSLPSEKWRPIEGYEGLYSISNLGRIFSHKSHRYKSHRYLSPFKDKDGYLFVKLYKGGKGKQMKVHRLVLSAFSPRDDSDCLDCNHINGIKDDNRLENLEWVSHAKNLRHSVDVLNNYHGPTRKAVAQFSREGIRLNVFRSIMDAERATGVYKSSICLCAKGRLRHAGGYIWRYSSDLPEEGLAH